MSLPLGDGLVYVVTRDGVTYQGLVESFYSDDWVVLKDANIMYVDSKYLDEDSRAELHVAYILLPKDAGGGRHVAHMAIPRERIMFIYTDPSTAWERRTGLLEPMKCVVCDGHGDLRKEGIPTKASYDSEDLRKCENCKGTGNCLEESALTEEQKGELHQYSLGPSSSSGGI